MLGPGTDFELQWVSVYSFTCRRMQRFRHGPVFFVGDSAHVVSPFGARGGNGGIQDVDALCWKLDLVLKGEVPPELLDSYDAERIPAADENILNSTRATDFMTPRSRAGAALRDATLAMAAALPFARRLVNSGRLSLPHSYRASPLSTPDGNAWAGGPPPGAPAPDAPVDASEGAPWLLRRLGGRFVLLRFVDSAATPAEAGDLVAGLLPAVEPLTVARSGRAGPGVVVDRDGLAFERWAARDGAAYLIRPDQHVAARWLRPDAGAIAAALDRAVGRAAMRAGVPPAGDPMGGLATGANFTDPDGFYAGLAAAYDGLDEAASRRLDARLILLLANHIGDSGVLAEALRLAKPSGGG
jgi:3-(3-hydroxy-phenyl)propionate hydroxylase